MRLPGGDLGGGGATVRQEPYPNSTPVEKLQIGVPPPRSVPLSAALSSDIHASITSTAFLDAWHHRCPLPRHANRPATKEGNFQRMPKGGANVLFPQGGAYRTASSFPKRPKT